MKTLYITIFWFFVIPFFVGFQLYAQKISGTVYELNEENEQQPLVGVNVYWAGSQVGTITDSEGKFLLQRLQNNTVLVVSYIGYETDTFNIKPEDNNITITLISDRMLGEVDVVARGAGAYVSQLHAIHTQVITTTELRKAACCNLSESFETNASVDVAYGDAITGAKQIQLLGLAGSYTQIMTENIPNIRGLVASFGLDYIPGPWMQSILVSKGTASVVNGHEAIAGQINVEYKKPEGHEKLHLNAYASSEGAIETNANTSIKINEKWSTALMAHFQNNSQKNDHNEDTFLDHPLMRQYNVFNRWYFNNGKNYQARFGVKIVEEDRNGGQINFEGNDYNNSNFYGIGIKTSHYEAFAKNAFLFRKPETSLGVITSANYHYQDSYFGHNSYSGEQLTGYLNVIFHSFIGNTNHSYDIGTNYVFDDYKESINDSAFNETESVAGVFGQYTFSTEKLTVIAGLRADYNNNFGLFFTPRLHLKYNFDDYTTLRASVGKGYRTVHIIAENSFLLASSRQISFLEQPEQESAWNYGGNISRKIYIWEREMNIGIDFYRTHFDNQVIIDLEQNPQKAIIYNLKGKSFSNSFQVEVGYELLKRLDVVVAYRLNDVQTTINNNLVSKPLINRYKGLITASYSTRLNKWNFDFTAQFNGDGRLPSTASNPVEYQRPTTFEAYRIFNAQITKNFKQWSFYVGGENLGNFTQHHPIIAAKEPFGKYFDSFMVWGPISGRKFYTGIRYTME